MKRRGERERKDGLRRKSTEREGKEEVKRRGERGRT